MKGDYSRFSDRPSRHYTGVLLQQGRVLLDADWNEQVTIGERRLRSLIIDLFGTACAPVGRDGFELRPTPDGKDLIVSPGRIYVDGIPVELYEGTAVHAESINGQTAIVRNGAPDAREFEAGQWVEVRGRGIRESGEPPPLVAKIVGSVLREDGGAELTLDGSLDRPHRGAGVLIRRLTTFRTQPFFDATAGSPYRADLQVRDWDRQTHVLYLEVWERHVTAVEDPHLSDAALGGLDTTARVQTVWRLGVLRHPIRGAGGMGLGDPVDASSISCDGPLPAWDQLTEHRNARLSVRTGGTATEGSEVTVPVGGYRGLENCLYRVEIHEPGALGAATFKWSRDNGSVMAKVEAIEDPTTIRVGGLGGLPNHQFQAGDRVEVFSNQTEFSGAPGVMASVIDRPGSAARNIRLDTDVSLFAGHCGLRVRRWDHGPAEPQTAVGWVELEHGVEVSFSGGPFRSGDYWVAAARPAGRTVEQLIDDPPHGGERHYARLALITWGDGRPWRIVDCRKLFRPLCATGP